MRVWQLFLKVKIDNGLTYPAECLAYRLVIWMGRIRTEMLLSVKDQNKAVSVAVVFRRGVQIRPGYDVRNALNFLWKCSDKRHCGFNLFSSCLRLAFQKNRVKDVSTQ